MNQDNLSSPPRGITRTDPKRQVFEETLGLAPSRNRLEGRAVLVVGAGQQPYVGPPPLPMGNGRAISLLSAREGAKVACLDKDIASAQETVSMIEHDGGHAVPIVADVSRPDDIDRAVQQTVAALGHLDGMVLNVGVGGMPGWPTVEVWDRTFAINLRSHMLFCKAALPLLVPGSSIVFISSIASLRPGTRIPSYDTSKAALAALGRHVALEGQDIGVRANVLAPGPIDTPLGRGAALRRPNRNTRKLPFNREGTAWEIAYVTVFLLSHESSFVNAQVIVVDGGITGLQLS
jgi:NAD(P)-dependent dehydrogenase (short-subunit alcohol dehydrogenase family)